MSGDFGIWWGYGSHVDLTLQPKCRTGHGKAKADSKNVQTKVEAQDWTRFSTPVLYLAISADGDLMKTCC